MSPSMPSPRPIRWACALVIATACTGCGDGDASSGLTPSPLDPTQVHYGRTYGEWAAAWVQWGYESAPGEECIDPLADVTGAECGHGQDEQNPVFFLVGSYSGAAVRTQCAVSPDKALFFPLVNASIDNAGIPASEQLDDA